MTKKEFKDRMLEIADTYSDHPDEAHEEADKLMCGLLRILGFGEGVDAYLDIEKWYS